MAAQGLPRESWIKIGLLGVAFIALFYRWMWNQGLHSAEAMEDWGHAFVIPLISGYMLWQHRYRDDPPRRPFWPGLAPMPLLGVVCYLLHRRRGQHAPSDDPDAGGHVPCSLMGLRPFRYVFLPISYLVFAVTVAEQINDELTFQLQARRGRSVAGAAAHRPHRQLPGGPQRQHTHRGLLRAQRRRGLLGDADGVVAFIAFSPGAPVAISFPARYWWQRGKR